MVCRYSAIHELKLAAIWQFFESKPSAFSIVLTGQIFWEVGAFFSIFKNMGYSIRIPSLRDVFLQPTFEAPLACKFICGSESPYYLATEFNPSVCLNNQQKSPAVRQGFLFLGSRLTEVYLSNTICLIWTLWFTVNL